MARTYDAARLGTAVPRLNVAHVRDLVIPTPPLSEQRQIVAEIEKQFTRLVVGGFVSYAWRWKIFRGWLVPFPDLNGTWQGSIQTTWTNPETGAIPAPIPVVLTIKQACTRSSCVMRTAEMTSRSYLADFWLDGDEQVRMLGYSYHSKPSPSVVERSQPHDGTIIFELINDPVEKLKGTYWTARKTTGEVILTFREDKRLDEFPPDSGKHPVSGK